MGVDFIADTSLQIGLVYAATTPVMPVGSSQEAVLSAICAIAWSRSTCVMFGESCSSCPICQICSMAPFVVVMTASGIEGIAPTAVPGVPGTAVEKGYPRVPSGALPKGKYTVKVLTPLVGVSEGGEHDVSGPKVEIEVGS